MKRQFTAWFMGLLLTICLAGCGGGGSGGDVGGNGGGGGTSASLKSIEVTPSDKSIAPVTAQQFTATGTYSDNTTKDITSSVSWSSLNQAVATIIDSAGSKGLANAIATGSTTITATLGSISGDTKLTVAALQSATINLPQTGQTKSYGTNANDDGKLQRGVSWPSPRFAVGTGDEAGCITDNLTGLMWVKSPDSTKRTWADAVSYAYTTPRCGHNDWRLPNRNELRSLVNYGQSDSATWLVGEGFSNVQADQYWSSTAYGTTTDSAWTINMGDGSTSALSKGDLHYEWPVR